MALMPPFAPLVALFFLGSILGLLGAGAALGFGALTRNRALLRGSAAAAAVLLVFYASLLLGASLSSRDRLLGSGEWKYFCELDCHIAYAVDRVTVSDSLGVPGEAVHPHGRFTTVELRTWFDESTISRERPRDAPLTPNPRRVYVVDAGGHRFDRSFEGERALAAAGVSSMPLTTPLIPGQSYTTSLVFDLPGDVREPRLYVGDADPVSHLLVGHEESPLHRKIWFRL